MWKYSWNTGLPSRNNEIDKFSTEAQRLGDGTKNITFVRKE